MRDLATIVHCVRGETSWGGQQVRGGGNICGRATSEREREGAYIHWLEVTSERGQHYQRWGEGKNTGGTPKVASSKKHHLLEYYFAPLKKAAKQKRKVGEFCTRLAVSLPSFDLLVACTLDHCLNTLQNVINSMELESSCTPDNEIHVIRICSAGKQRKSRASLGPGRTAAALSVYFPWLCVSEKLRFYCESMCSLEAQNRRAGGPSLSLVRFGFPRREWDYEFQMLCKWPHGIMLTKMYVLCSSCEKNLQESKAWWSENATLQKWSQMIPIKQGRLPGQGHIKSDHADADSDNSEDSEDTDDDFTMDWNLNRTFCYLLYNNAGLVEIWSKAYVSPWVILFRGGGEG